MSCAAKLISVLFLMLSISTPCVAGAVGGARKVEGKLADNEPATYTIEYEGGKEARAYTTAISEHTLSVHDKSGRLVAKEESVCPGLCDVHLKWTPPVTAAYTIRITSGGRLKYTFWTN